MSVGTVGYTQPVTHLAPNLAPLLGTTYTEKTSDLNQSVGSDQLNFINF